MPSILGALARVITKGVFSRCFHGLLRVAHAAFTVLKASLLTKHWLDGHFAKVPIQRAPGSVGEPHESAIDLRRGLDMGVPSHFAHPKMGLGVLSTFTSSNNYDPNVEVLGK